MTGTPDRAAADNVGTDDELAMREWLREQGHRIENTPPSDGMGGRNEAAQLRARIAVIRAHLAAADAQTDAELHATAPAYADHDGDVLDQHDADDRCSADGRGWSA